VVEVEVAAMETQTVMVRSAENRTLQSKSKTQETVVVKSIENRPLQSRSKTQAKNEDQVVVKATAKAKVSVLGGAEEFQTAGKIQNQHCQILEC
jgi:hypothetical protein